CVPDCFTGGGIGVRAGDGGEGVPEGGDVTGTGGSGMGAGALSGSEGTAAGGPPKELILRQTRKASDALHRAALDSLFMFTPPCGQIGALHIQATGPRPSGQLREVSPLAIAVPQPGWKGMGWRFIAEQLA